MAIGAGVGILFAPKSGKETREAIAAAFKKTEKKVEEKADGVAAEAGAGFHEVTTFS
jgi:gas vesicle protein